MSSRTACRGWLRRALALGALAGAFVAALASPAGAHATLVESTPAPAQVLAGSPTAIELRFTEPVDAASRSVRVYDLDGSRVDRGGVRSEGTTVRLPLPTLADGPYVVTWRVTSADAHPVQGTFTFQVGAGSDATAPEVRDLARRLLAADEGDPVVGALYGITRWAAFAALALLVGSATFAAFVAPGVAGGRIRRLVWTGWGGLVAATVVGLLVYGPYAEQLGLGDAWSGSVIDQTLSTRFGTLGLVRLGLLLVAMPLLARWPRLRPGAPPAASVWREPGSIVAVGLALALCATPGLSGHAASGDWRALALVADVAHVLAMSVWLGGLVPLATVVLADARRDPGRWREPAQRWSRLAFWCVVTLVVTGAFQSWRQVRSVDALLDTEYGRILIVKVVVFAVLLAVARAARDRVAASEPTRLRGAVWTEVVTGAAVLVVTALLVNAPPARLRAGSDSPGVAAAYLEDARLAVDVTVAPGRAGPNTVHVSVFNAAGAPLEVAELVATIDLAARDVAPLALPLRRLGPGHYVAPGFVVPFPGTWRLTVKPRLGEFDQVTLVGTLTISPLAGG